MVLSARGKFLKQDLKGIFEAQSPRPPMPLSTLQASPRDDTCKAVALHFNRFFLTFVATWAPGATKSREISHLRPWGSWANELPVLD